MKEAAQDTTQEQIQASKKKENSKKIADAKTQLLEQLVRTVEVLGAAQIDTTELVNLIHQNIDTNYTNFSTVNEVINLRINLIAQQSIEQHLFNSMIPSEPSLIASIMNALHALCEQSRTLVHTVFAITEDIYWGYTEPNLRYVKSAPLGSSEAQTRYAAMCAKYYDFERPAIEAAVNRVFQYREQHPNFYPTDTFFEESIQYITFNFETILTEMGYGDRIIRTPNTTTTTKSEQDEHQNLKTAGTETNKTIAATEITTNESREASAVHQAQSTASVLSNIVLNEPNTIRSLDAIIEESLEELIEESSDEIFSGRTFVVGIPN